MSRRKIKIPGGHTPKPRGRHATREADMYKRHQPIRALENMRRYNEAMRAFEEAKAKEAEVERSRAAKAPKETAKETEAGNAEPEEGVDDNGEE